MQHIDFIACTRHITNMEISTSRACAPWYLVMKAGFVSLHYMFIAYLLPPLSTLISSLSDNYPKRQQTDGKPHLKKTTVESRDLYCSQILMHGTWLQ